MDYGELLSFWVLVASCGGRSAGLDAFRQKNRENGSAHSGQRPCSHPNAAAMFADDAERQPQSESCPCVFLRCVKRFEEMFKVFCADSAAVVGDHHADTPASAVCVFLDRPDS